MENKINEFPVAIYGNLESYNQTLSKARCRIFYKYENRNGTYITDAFAEKLAATLPYTPVKGIYDNYDEDYTDHGAKRDLGRIYGIVPENPNVKWETHVDEDGIEREYCCADVLIFTALYEEASEIVGKAQSMELYEPSLQYHMELINGSKVCVFDEGCFLGLQILGEVVEPCFEGAAFYDLRDSIEDVINRIKEYTLSYNKGGNEEMQINFKLSDDQKYSVLWSLLNTEFNEEGNWTQTYSINSVYDDYAIAFNLETGDYERVYYIKDDSSDEITIGERVKCFIIDVTETEKNTLDTLRLINGNTYELVNENLLNAEKNAEENATFGIKIEEQENTISTLTTERDEARNSYAALSAEVEELKNYKAGIVKQAKEAVIAEYTESMNEEILQSYSERLDEFEDAESLDKELAYQLKKNNPSIFSAKPQLVPKHEPRGGIEEILSKYAK